MSDPPVIMGAVIREPSPRALVAASGVGSVLVAVSSYWVAAFPFSFRVSPPVVVDLLPPQAVPARVAWYLGLGLLALAWLGFGRRFWRGEDVAWRTVRASGVVAAVPLLVAMPLSSRDLWAYVGQARIAAAGANPYTVSPAAFGHGLAGDVSARWVDSVSPYGPLWTVLSRLLATVVPDGQQALLALVLRLPAFLGFALLVVVVPALARRVGIAPALPVWLVVANPLVVVHGVGGGHNDTLMVGLVAAGLLVALSAGPRWWVLLAGGVLVGAGAAIKIPALVAAPFLPLLWLRYAPGAAAWSALPWREAVRLRARPVLLGLAWSMLGALGVLVLTTVAAGRGTQWLAAANTAEHGGGPGLTAVVGLVLLGLWLAAVARPPLPLLALALIAPALISVLPLFWYWTWPLVPAALFLRGRVATFAVAVVSLDAIFYIRPNGQNLPVGAGFAIVLVAVAAWWVLDRHWRPLSRPPVGTARTGSPVEGVR